MPNLHSGGVIFSFDYLFKNIVLLIVNIMWTNLIENITLKFNGTKNKQIFAD